MEAKNLFTLKQYIVILLIAQDELIMNLGTGISISTILKLLKTKFGLEVSDSRVRTIIKELCDERIVEKTAMLYESPFSRFKAWLNHYRVINFYGAFKNIQADRKKLHRLRDTIRHQRHRKARRVKERRETQDQGTFRVIRYHGEKVI